MPKGELYIRKTDSFSARSEARYNMSQEGAFVRSGSGMWVDAYEQWGMSLEDTGVSALMTPVPMKERAKNKSRLRHGEEMAGTLERVDSREITVPFHITAADKADCMRKYASLCELLYQGAIDLWVMYTPDVVYRCKYVSCMNFGEFMMQMMKFSLKLEEPNPNNRTLEYQ